MAFFSALLATHAVLGKNFWLLVAGYYNANGQLYRFTTAELAKSDADAARKFLWKKTRAIRK